MVSKGYFVFEPLKIEIMFILRWMSAVWVFFILIMPYKIKKKMNVNPMNHLGDTSLKYLSLKYYKYLHKTAKVQLRVLVKKKYLQSRESFDITLAHYHLLLKDNILLRISLVRQADNMERIEEVFKYVKLSEKQKLTLLDRLWGLIKDDFTIRNTKFMNLYIDRSSEFFSLNERKDLLRERVVTLMRTLTFDDSYSAK